MTLTIDADLQRVAWQAIEGRAGSVVAMDPRDGAILAMVSSPSFDPNLFNEGISSELWKQLQGNPFAPLSNKAISGQYPPGSTYKLIVAAAALEEGIISPETKIFCNGSYTLGNRTYRCWKKGGHGHVDLHQALVGSCDVYFYTVGKMLGVDKIAEYAKRFGLGDFAGIDLPNEKKGWCRPKEWKLKKKKRPGRWARRYPYPSGRDLIWLRLYNWPTPTVPLPTVASCGGRMSSKNRIVRRQNV